MWKLLYNYAKVIWNCAKLNWPPWIVLSHPRLQLHTWHCSHLGCHKLKQTEVLAVGSGSGMGTKPWTGEGVQNATKSQRMLSSFIYSILYTYHIMISYIKGSARAGVLSQLTAYAVSWPRPLLPKCPQTPHYYLAKYTNTFLIYQCQAQWMTTGHHFLHCVWSLW